MLPFVKEEQASNAIQEKILENCKEHLPHFLAVDHVVHIHKAVSPL